MLVQNKACFISKVIFLSMSLLIIVKNRMKISIKEDKLLSYHFFYNCSKEYVESIDQGLFSEINEVIGNLPKRNVQAEINADIFWLLTKNTWAYDSMPQGLSNIAHSLSEPD